MSEHSATISWKKGTPDYTYETYDRSHKMKFEGGIEINASAGKEFLGNAKHANPEELLAGALASCHMLTFLAIAAKSRLVVESYEDHAVAVLDKNAEGKMAVTKIRLSPKVTFGGERPAPEKIKDLHDKAHKNCFIGNSIKCDVTY